MELLLIAFVVIGLILLIGSFMFVSIPRNHIVCVEISGGFVHLMAHSNDKRRIEEAIKLLPASLKIPPVPGTPAVIDRIMENWENIVTRDSWAGNWYNLFLVPLMVKFFNLHLKSWIPWAGLRKVKVVKTHINAGYTQGNTLDKKISYENPDPNKRSEETVFLRIEFPRVGFFPEIELKNVVQVDIVWSISKVTIFHPFDVFYHNNEISSWLDFQVNQGMVNYMGQKDLDEFQKEDLTANPVNLFNGFFKELSPTAPAGTGVTTAAITSIGILITGEISVVDFQLDKSQQDLADAKVRLEAERSNLERRKLEAEGDAVKIKLPGVAHADARKALLLAEAEGAEALSKVMKEDPATAEIYRIRAYGGNVTTVVNGANTGVMLPASPPPAPAPKTTI